MAVLTPPRHHWLGARGLGGPEGLTAKIAVRLTPRAGRDGVEGKANEALERLLAKVLKVAKSSVRVVSGAIARLKQVEITGLEQEEALARLGFTAP